MFEEFAGRRVTVMGLGRFGGGVGVTQWLCSQGADVLVTDREPADRLAASVEHLRDLLDSGQVTLRLGEHNVSDFTTCDLLVVNPAVKPEGNRFLRAAEAAGVEITSEIRLLVQRLPRGGRERVIGVTGSAGKSTVTAMTGHLLGKGRRDEGTQGRSKEPASSLRPFVPPSLPHRVWLGGNLGGSLLPHLTDITPDDWVVLELSSFQLESLRPEGWSPGIAVLTNLTPNHLDWHGTFEAYRDAKAVIYDYQQPGDTLVLGEDVEPVPADVPLRVVGAHNRQNAAIAIAATVAACKRDGSLPRSGLPADLLSDFAGLPHRLAFVAERGGVKFYNDSKCTTPEAGILAIDSFPVGTVHLIAGGYDKGSDLTAFAAHAAARCRGLYTIGTTGPTLASHAEAAAPLATPLATPRAATVHRCGTLDAAVRQAAESARPGEVVLLSPGCASWDQFAHYEQRGEAFRGFVVET